MSLFAGHTLANVPSGANGAAARIDKSGRTTPPHYGAAEQASAQLQRLAERLRSLDGLTALTRLVAYKTPVTDLAPLRGCRSLTNLQLKPTLPDRY